MALGTPSIIILSVSDLLNDEIIVPPNGVKGGQLAALKPFLSDPSYISKLHHTILKFNLTLSFLSLTRNKINLTRNKYFLSKGFYKFSCIHFGFSFINWTASYTMRVHFSIDCIFKYNITTIARNPRAPVFFSRACEAIALSASSVNVNSTLSKPNSNLNCLTVLFFGSCMKLLKQHDRLQQQLFYFPFQYQFLHQIQDSEKYKNINAPEATKRILVVSTCTVSFRSFLVFFSGTLTTVPSNICKKYNKYKIYYKRTIRLVKVYQLHFQYLLPHNQLVSNLYNHKLRMYYPFVAFQIYDFWIYVLEKASTTGTSSFQEENVINMNTEKQNPSKLNNSIRCTTD
ncbi:hypothetical protein AGLY_004470, partial [Aphis glycines]